MAQSWLKPIDVQTFHFAPMGAKYMEPPVYPSIKPFGFCMHCGLVIDDISYVGYYLRVEVIHMGKHEENYNKLKCRPCQMEDEFRR